MSKSVNYVRIGVSSVMHPTVRKPIFALNKVLTF